MGKSRKLHQDEIVRQDEAIPAEAEPLSRAKRDIEHRLAVLHLLDRRTGHNRIGLDDLPPDGRKMGALPMRRIAGVEQSL